LTNIKDRLGFAWYGNPTHILTTEDLLYFNVSITY